MPINRDYIGRTWTLDRTYEVSRQKIREFATAVGETAPVIFDQDAARAAGYDDVVPPPTFLTVLDHLPDEKTPINEPEMNVEMHLGVHGEQEFVFHRPIKAGDVLSKNCVIEDIRDAGRNEIVVVREDITDADGELVATMRMTVVQRGTAGKEA